jgi:transposase InsO family protein
MTGGHVSSQTSQAVVATVTYLKRRAGFPICESLRVLGLPRATYFGWQRTDGKQPRAPGVIPRGHRLTPAERAAIVAYKRQHPAIGYRRLAYMMLDEGVAAVPASSVYRVLAQAGLASRWTQAPGQEHKKGFDQPQRIHEQWHTDIAYLNILGTHYFFLGVLDGYSRAIIHHEVRLDMTTTDVEIVIERALAQLPAGLPRPRLITDNGPQYLSVQFKAYLRERDVSHSRARPHHPQSNGKMERFHKSLKVECVRVTAMSDLDEARRLVGQYVEEYNAQRLHSALHYLTPADYLRGPEHVRQRLEARRVALTEAARHRRAYWKAIVAAGGVGVVPVSSQQITPPVYHVA